ncbi:hypothetical protein HDU86_002466 [Geranomyces michiganensis]|nr:hypothetical protein HDU86_002466 [Geranomyces michiganensis]
MRNTTVHSSLRAWSAFRLITFNEGYLALYAGLPSALLWAIPATVTYLCTYEFIRARLGGANADRATVVHFIAAGVAELVSNVFWCPMEVVKSRQQAKGGEGVSRQNNELDNIDDTVLLNPLYDNDDDDDGDTYPAPQSQAHTHSLSTLQFMRQLYTQQGLGGFYVGFWLGVLVYLPYSILYFILYEKFKNLAAGNLDAHQQAGLSVWAILACSALAGLIAAAATNPIDGTFFQKKKNKKAISSSFPFYNDPKKIPRTVPKTAYQVAADGSRTTTINTNNTATTTEITFTQTVLKLYRQSGWRAFTAGMSARCAWMVPTIVIQFTVFEQVKRSLA